MIQISLAAARVNANLTQEQVAEKMNVSKKSIVDWEKGRTIPSSASLFMLSTIYNFPLDNIFLPEKSTLSEVNGSREVNQ